MNGFNDMRLNTRSCRGASCAIWTVLVSLVSFFSVADLDAQESEVTAPVVPAGDDEAPVTRAEYDRVLEELGQLRLEFDAAKQGGQVNGDSGSSIEAEQSRLGGYRGGLYDKPFLGPGVRRAYLGGYFDVEYRDPENARHEFRFHRLIPFIYADVHERIRFATEIEIEDGSDVAVEFAFLDFLVFSQANFRGGVILDPLGKFNLIHDSPINDLTDRPLVSRFVTPTTLREVGVGLFGTLTPPDSGWEVAYEAYLVSGFKGLDRDGNVTITSASGIRGARPHSTALGTSRFDDNNNKFAGVGRLSVSPFLGSEFGISGHSGAYDERGNNNLTTGALDGIVTIPEFRVSEVPVGPIEVIGEGAINFVERDSFARASGVADDMWGYYLQSNYHFMPDWLIRNAGAIFFPGSTFTAVYRWDQIDLDGNKQRRSTVGMNYRPIESMVFKCDYQFNQGKGSAPDSSDNDAVVLSLTSYF